MEHIFLDNAATTKPFPQIKKVINEMMDGNYANPSSMHMLGLNAQNIISSTQKNIASELSVSGDEIYFTSGGTESNNLAITGAAYAYFKTGKHIITSEVEHPSVYETVKMLEANKFEVDILNVDSQGLISIDNLKSKLRNDTVLVSLNHVNNEIGSIHNINQIGNAIKKINNATLFHVDAVQSFGKLKISPNKDNIDLLSVSAHKIHALKGCGVLYIKKGVRIKPLFYGGGQQKNLRCGTENIIGIAALNTAIKLLKETGVDNHSYVLELKRLLLEALSKNFEIIKINGQKLELSSPYILSVVIKDIKGEVLLNALSEKNVFISTGSACNSRKAKKSRVLKSIGLNENEIDGTIRFGLSVLNTKKDIELCIKAMQQTIGYAKI